MFNTASDQRELQNSPALCHKYKFRLCIFFLPYLSSYVSLMKTENLHAYNKCKKMLEHISHDMVGSEETYVPKFDRSFRIKHQLLPDCGMVVEWSAL